MMHNIRWQTMVKDAWAKEIGTGEYDVIGTLNFIDGSKMGVKQARIILDAYWKSVDKLFFGHATKKGMGVKRWCFLEFGGSGTNLHMQFAAQSPVETDLFCCILNIMWSNFRRETAAMKFNHITTIICKELAASYNGKEDRHFRENDVGLKCSHQNPVGTAYDTSKNHAQIARILNRLKIEELDEAEQAYTAHMIMAQDKIDRHKARNCVS